MAFSASEPVICSAYVDFVAAITSVQASSISFFVVRFVHHGRCGFLAWLVSEDSGISVPGSLQGRREWLALRLLIDGVKELVETRPSAGACPKLLAVLWRNPRAGFACKDSSCLVCWPSRRSRRGSWRPLGRAAAAETVSCRSVLRSIGERSSGAYYHRFFRVDESFRADTRAGLTRARSLNTWVYSERNAVTHLPRRSLL